jgi:hypothetical protein
MQKSIFPFVIISFLYLNRLFSQGFYDIEQIQEIKLTFSQTNWDAQLDQLKATDEEAYLLAASVEVNGIVFDSVGVKYKGNSSYNANNQKNPMHIELNYVHKNADYDGFSDIKLGNGFSDPSFVREPLSYEIVGKYMVAPRANYAKLWINGVYWGVYSNQESINKQLVKAHLYTDGDNPLFKCNPVGGAGPGSSGGNPDLVYSSADSTAYYSKYELKSDYGWAQMLTLMSTLKNNPAQIESILDVDRALWMIALNNVLVNLDSYTGSFAQNYYLYQDENDRFIPIIWDLNMCFGGFPMLGSGGGGGGALSVTQMQQMDAAVQSTNASRPLIQKLLANPVYKRQYLAHIRTILAENFATTAYKTRALELQALISQAVQDDTKKFYTFANFTSNIDNTVSTGGGGGGFGNVPGITLLMNARNTFLNGTALLSPLAPTITDVAPSTTTPVPGQEVWITAKITDASTVTLGHRSQFWAVFQKAQMFDDGAHQDGAAGDGIWGAALVADNVENQYYIYAENANAGRFSPERAEYEFHSFGTSLPAPASGQVVINEFLTNNQNGATDEFGQKEDWLEIYNRTGNAFDLAGLQLTDKASTPNKFIFPRGSVILPNGYLMVWLDEDGGQGLTHANFKLSNNGEFLMLSDSNGVVYDSLSFGAQTADISFGRYPNGTGIFQTMPTTFAKENSLVSAVNELYSKAEFNLYPNPAGDFIQVQSSQNMGNVVVQNALGQALIQINPDGQQHVHIPLNGIAPGMYWVRVQGAGVRAFVVMR